MDFKLLKSTLLLSVSSALSAVVPIYFLIVYSEFSNGAYFSQNALTYSVAGIFSLLIDGGLHQFFVMKSIEKNEVNKGKVLPAFFLQRLTMVFICLIFMGFWALASNQLELISVWWMALCLGTAQSLQPLWWFNAKHAHGRLLQINIVSKIMALLAFAWAVAGGSQVNGPVLAMLVGHFFMAGIMLVVVIRAEGLRFNALHEIYPSPHDALSYFFGRAGSTVPASGVSAYVGFFDLNLAGVIAFAETIYKTIRLSVSPLIQVAITRYLQNEGQIAEVIKITKALFTLNIIGGMMLVLFGELCVATFIPVIESSIRWIVVCYAVAGLISMTSSFLGFPAFAAINKYNDANKSLIIASVVAAICLLVFASVRLTWAPLIVLLFELVLIGQRFSTVRQGVVN